MAKSPFSALTKKQRGFVSDFLASDNVKESYRRNYSCHGMTENSIAGAASALKRSPKVAAAIEFARKDTLEKLEIGIQDVMQHWVDIATADPNELVSYQRRCCRHCWGRGHRYQWTDRDEFAYSLAGVMDANANRKRNQAAQELPSDSGGYGFNFTTRPHPECPKCRGEGIGDTYIHDTTKLSRQGRRLYAGLKHTQNGVTVLMNSQTDALANIAKALGMFTERLQLTGVNNGPILSAELPADPVEAAKVYQQLMKGAMT